MYQERRAQETVAAPPQPVLYLFFQLNGCQTASLTVFTMRGFVPPIYSLAGSECPFRVLLEGLDKPFGNEVICNRDEALIS